MKKIGTKSYVNMANVNSANVFEVNKDNVKGWKVCFVMKQGEPVYSEIIHTEGEAHSMCQD
jgi:hypothetical protein